MSLEAKKLTFRYPRRGRRPVLEGVELNPECLVAEDIFWHETEYRSNFNVKPLSMHHTAGPRE